MGRLIVGEKKRQKWRMGGKGDTLDIWFYNLRCLKHVNAVSTQ